MNAAAAGARAKPRRGAQPKQASPPPEEAPAAPDSTTREPDFAPGQDVLMKQKDGRYYLGTVVEVDVDRERCLVRFGDNTEGWSPFRDLGKLTAPEQEALLCVVCKKSAPRNSHEMAVCDKCGRGYHRKCHLPETTHNKDTWMCKRCTEPNRLRKNDQNKRRSVISTSRNENSFRSPVTKTLPYELSSLSWDTYHRVNTEHIYCYCGENGEWYKQMLQCGKCKQWFHERCIDCLHLPVYCGDRFYVFVCSICNHGKEFLRRLEMKWVDLVHLMLFNLTAYNSKKYYDLDTVIIPYINDNWRTLQLPPKISEVSKTERRDNILSVLTNNRNRFKCGREIKKRTTIWGLRVRLPPPAPTINLTSAPNTSTPINDEELREMWQGNRRLQFLAPPSGDLWLDSVEMRNIMMGVAYLQSGTPSETDSPCPSPEEELEEREIVGMMAGCAKKTVPFENVTQRRKSVHLLSTTNHRVQTLRPKRRNTNEGLSSVTEPLHYLTRLTLDTNHKTESLPPTPPTSVSAPPTPPAPSRRENTPTSDDDTSSKSTLDLIIPPPKDFEGKNNPFLALLRVGGTSGRSSRDITLPLPLNPVIPGKPIMRPKKRQLSEKDIFIGPNGEVKRRRFRRGRGGSLCGAASKTAAVVPPRSGEIKEWGENNFNGRRLRQRPEKPQEKEKSSPQPSTKPSPVKQEPDISMDELKSSVNMYFGAANRIAAGERFAVKAKRISPNGKLEYLIEWEGPGNGMT